MARTGRPTTYSDTRGNDVCELIAGGDSLAEACRKTGVNRRTFYAWLDAHPALQRNYARAKEARGDWFGERVSEIANAVLAGDVGYCEARVAIDAYKWTAARMSPKNFGDRVAIDVDAKQKHTEEDLERFAAQHGLKRLTQALTVDDNPETIGQHLDFQ